MSPGPFEIIVSVNPQNATLVTRNRQQNAFKAVSLQQDHDGADVHVTFAAPVRDVTLNAGFTMPAERMDELAMRWLTARGLLPQHLAGQWGPGNGPRVVVTMDAYRIYNIYASVPAETCAVNIATTPYGLDARPARNLTELDTSVLKKLPPPFNGW